MKGEARARALADFRAGAVQVLCNVAVLTEGFDDPGVSCVAMARPTRSEGLYAQCVGRGTRLHPGKSDCLILDFVDVSQLSLCSLPSLFGVPRELNLQGEDVNRARHAWQQILLDHPGFELEAGSFTLPEIQERANAFDPLTLEAHEEVRAISGNAWFSLGRHGLGLHFEKRPGVVAEPGLAISQLLRHRDDIHGGREDEAVRCAARECDFAGRSRMRCHGSSSARARESRQPAERCAEQFPARL
jgi:hypothetical protein